MFDEAHYVPAADALARLADDSNWEHPPLAKWILGFGARFLSEWLHLVPPLPAYRIVTAAFGLWALVTIALILRDAGMDSWAAQASAWLTGTNFLWFAQSRTAMLDMFAVAFALAGLREVRRGGEGIAPFAGWALLGFAMGCKWSAAPFVGLALFWARGSLLSRVAGVFCCGVAYVVPFLPLALLTSHATPATEIIAYQHRMLEGFGRVPLASHPYTSQFWQWPTLLRPAWYHFEQGPAGDRYVWAGGNPLLYALALPATAWVGLLALRRSATPLTRSIALLYWIPLAFDAGLRRAQVYYYFLPSSLLLGPPWCTPSSTSPGSAGEPASSPRRSSRSRARPSSSTSHRCSTVAWSRATRTTGSCGSAAGDRRVSSRREPRRGTNGPGRPTVMAA